MSFDLAKKLLLDVAKAENKQQLEASAQVLSESLEEMDDIFEGLRWLKDPDEEGNMLLDYALELNPRHEALAKILDLVIPYIKMHAKRISEQVYMSLYITAWQTKLPHIIGLLNVNIKKVLSHDNFTSIYQKAINEARIIFGESSLDFATSSEFHQLAIAIKDIYEVQDTNLLKSYISNFKKLMNEEKFLFALLEEDCSQTSIIGKILTLPSSKNNKSDNAYANQKCIDLLDIYYNAIQNAITNGIISSSDFSYILASKDVHNFSAINYALINCNSQVVSKVLQILTNPLGGVLDKNMREFLISVPSSRFSILKSAVKSNSEQTLEAIIKILENKAYGLTIPDWKNMLNCKDSIGFNILDDAVKTNNPGICCEIVELLEKYSPKLFPKIMLGKYAEGDKLYSSNAGVMNLLDYQRKKHGFKNDGFPKDRFPKDRFPKDGFPKDGFPKKEQKRKVNLVDEKHHSRQKRCRLR